MNDSAEDRRTTVKIILWSISTKVWDRVGLELATPGSAVRLASVARHVTDCATWPALLRLTFWLSIEIKVSLKMLNSADNYSFSMGPPGLTCTCWTSFCFGIQFYFLSSPYLCFISLLYLDLYVLGDDTLIC